VVVTVLASVWSGWRATVVINAAWFLAALGLYVRHVRRNRASDRPGNSVPTESRITVSLAEPSATQRREPPLDYHPIYGLPIIIISVTLIATLGWWSLLLLALLCAAIVHFFFWRLRLD
jgi:hypothetical protein